MVEERSEQQRLETGMLSNHLNFHNDQVAVVLEIAKVEEYSNSAVEAQLEEEEMRCHFLQHYCHRLSEEEEERLYSLV